MIGCPASSGCRRRVHSTKHVFRAGVCPKTVGRPSGGRNGRGTGPAAGARRPGARIAPPRSGLTLLHPLEKEGVRTNVSATRGADRRVGGVVGGGGGGLRRTS